MSDEAARLLQRLVACDTSTRPDARQRRPRSSRTTSSPQASVCERPVAKDPERPNLLATLPGRGTGPSRAFLGHFDVVQARREDWSLEPFAGSERDGAIWGRGTVDMKSQVAVTAARDIRARGVRAQRRPDADPLRRRGGRRRRRRRAVPRRRPNPTVPGRPRRRRRRRARPNASRPPSTCSTTASSRPRARRSTVRGRAGDVSLPDTVPSAALARLLTRLAEYTPRPRIHPDVRPLIDFLARDGGDDAERVARAHAANPALGMIIGALVTSVIAPAVLDAAGPANVGVEEATASLQCVPLLGVTKDELETELRVALGDGDYTVEVVDPEPGLASPTGTPLHHAIEEFLAEHDPEAHLIPTLGYGYSYFAGVTAVPRTSPCRGCSAGARPGTLNAAAYAEEVAAGIRRANSSATTR